VDDCIDTQTEFNAGGARYYWSVSIVAGLVNVIDSLNVVRELVFEQKLYDAHSFHAAMDARDPLFLRRARKCPCFGVDGDKADELGARLANAVYDSFEMRSCYPRGRYMTVSNQFTTYEGAGRPVHATPDGRADGAPLCDSLGAVHGKDIAGPTALLSSTAKLPLRRVTGTPVMNIRIKKENLSTLLKPLVQAFFEKGGMQLQVSCLSRQDMLDAIAHPERHENLIVRVGGFSEYFNRLTPVLQQTVLARTEY
jgi:formate C-acetyltransferase